MRGMQLLALAAHRRCMADIRFNKLDNDHPHIQPADLRLAIAHRLGELTCLPNRWTDWWTVANAIVKVRRTDDTTGCFLIEVRIDGGPLRRLGHSRRRGVEFQHETPAGPVDFHNSELFTTGQEVAMVPFDILMAMKLKDLVLPTGWCWRDLPSE